MLKSQALVARPVVFVPGSSHVIILVRFIKAFVSYQDYHMLSLLQAKASAVAGDAISGISTVAVFGMHGSVQA